MIFLFPVAMTISTSDKTTEFLFEYVILRGEKQYVTDTDWGKVKVFCKIVKSINFGVMNIILRGEGGG